MRPSRGTPDGHANHVEARLRAIVENCGAPECEREAYLAFARALYRSLRRPPKPDYSMRTKCPRNRDRNLPPRPERVTSCELRVASDEGGRMKKTSLQVAGCGLQLAARSWPGICVICVICGYSSPSLGVLGDLGGFSSGFATANCKLVTGHSRAARVVQRFFGRGLRAKLLVAIGREIEVWLFGPGERK
jgi:hypothetical protein